jgi:RNA polymerase sigma-70 factor (ECF subfamily)
MARQRRGDRNGTRNGRFSDPSAESPGADGPTDPSEIQAAIRTLQAGGDPDAFEPIYRRYRPSLQVFFANRPELREEAEDLTHKTLLRAFRNIRQYRFDSSFGTWLRKIGENVWKNARRSRRTAKRYAPTSSLTVLDADGEDEVRDPEDKTAFREPPASPEEAVLAAERTRVLRDAMAELPSGMRTCVELRVTEDLKYREIAERTGIGMNSVRSQLHEARKRLGPVLRKYFGGAEL